MSGDSNPSTQPTKTVHCTCLVLCISIRGWRDPPGDIVVWRSAKFWFRSAVARTRGTEGPNLPRKMRSAPDVPLLGTGPLHAQDPCPGKRLAGSQSADAIRFPEHDGCCAVCVVWFSVAAGFATLAPCPPLIVNVESALGCSARILNQGGFGCALQIACRISVHCTANNFASRTRRAQGWRMKPLDLAQAGV